MPANKTKNVYHGLHPLFFALVLLAAPILAASKEQSRPQGSPAKSATSSTKMEKIRLALNWKPEPEFGGFYQASLGELFSQRGLETEIIVGGSGTPVVPMIAAGKAEFGISSADEVLLARARGADVVAIFAVYQTNPQGIMVHAKRGFKNLAEVFSSDGVLAMQRGLPYAEFLQRKFSRSKVQIVPYLGGIQNFLVDEKYSQQCFVTAEPIAARQAGKEVQTFLVADVGFNPYTAVVITRESTIRDRRGMVLRFVQAVRGGWEEYLKDPTSANSFMHKLNSSMDLETFAASAKAQQNLISLGDAKENYLGYMSNERWSELAKQLIDLGLIKDASKIPSINKAFVNFAP